MNLLKTIKDSDFGLNTSDPVSYKEREAGRAVVFDRENNIALLNVSKKYYHKLPGGGVESGEDFLSAMKREVLEEIGCAVDNISELGIIEEYRNEFSVHQISYCYIAYLLGEKGEPHFEGDEIDDGFEPVWMNLDEAIRILESEEGVEDYEGKFIRLRDLIFLKQARKLMSKV